MSAHPEPQQRALAVFAHPDDETLLAGALIAAWASAGRRVDLLCLAPGNDDHVLARMELAARELGIASVSSLRFRGGDSALSEQVSGSPALIETPEHVLVERIAGRMAELRPEVVLTHSSYGDYGHADHALTYRLTMKAAAEAVPSAQVYALAWSRRVIRLNASLIRLGSRFRREPWIENRFDLSSELKSAPPVTETVNVRPFLAQRKRAAKHYAKEISQGPLPMRLMEAAPAWAQAVLLGKARLSRVR